MPVFVGTEENDVYFINADDEDIFERPDGGFDTAYVSINLAFASNSFQLPDNVEMLVLTNRAGGASARGNGGDNILVGNDFRNILSGFGGKDTMYGGKGDDFYVPSSSDDTIVEYENGGAADFVYAHFSFALSDNVEELLIDRDSGDAYGTGNNQNNTITGSDGNNRIDGKGGIDTMVGRNGDDTYYVDVTGDVIVEKAGEGRDTIISAVSIKSLADSVEALTLTGSFSLYANGNNLSNTIIGNAGSNVINGDLGKDILTGGAGKDYFLFATAIGTANVDRITDFKPVDDTIRLENAIFTALTTTGTLASSAFKDITDGAKLDANDRVLYNHDTGRLSYDADGSGSKAAVLIGILDGHPTLTFQDFQVV